MMAFFQSDALCFSLAFPGGVKRNSIGVWSLNSDIPVLLIPADHFW